MLTSFLRGTDVFLLISAPPQHEPKRSMCLHTVPSNQSLIWLPPFTAGTSINTYPGSSRDIYTHTYRAKSLKKAPQHIENRLQASQQLSADWTLMRLGEQGVLSLEQWLEREAAAVRDGEAAAAKEGDEPAGRGQQPTSVSVAAAGGGLPSSTSVGGGVGEGGAGTGGFRVGVDPWLLSAGTARSLTSKLAKNGGCLVPISG